MSCMLFVFTSGPVQEGWLVYCSPCMFVTLVPWLPPFIILYVFFWVGCIRKWCLLCHYLFFFGTLVASLRHSGFCIPRVLACPGFFSYRLFFFFLADLITCNRVPVGGNVCYPVLVHVFIFTLLHACLKSCHRYHQCTALLLEVASHNGQLGVMSCHVTLGHVMPCLAAMPGSSWIPPFR